MKRLVAVLLGMSAVLVSAGCGPIDYERDITPVAGRKVYVGPAKITNCHAQLDKAGTEAEIQKTAKDLLKHYGYTVVEDAGSADLVLSADVLEFNLGSTTARVIVGAGQSWHDTSILIKPQGGLENTGHRRAEVSAGAYSNFKGAEQHRKALVNEIAKMHVWVAAEYCP